MRSNPRCVFDTNVLVSALLFDQSKPAQAFFAALHTGGVLVSADTIVEVSSVLSREKFERYVTEEERERFLRSLLRETRLVDIREKVRACRDPKDDNLQTLFWASCRERKRKNLKIDPAKKSHASARIA